VSLVSASFARDEVKMGEREIDSLQGVELWRELGLAYHADRPCRSPALRSSLLRAVGEGLNSAHFPASTR